MARILAAFTFDSPAAGGYAVQARLAGAPGDAAMAVGPSVTRGLVVSIGVLVAVVIVGVAAAWLVFRRGRRSARR